MHEIMLKTAKLSYADIYFYQCIAICSKNHAKLKSISSDNFRIIYLLLFWAMTDRFNVYQRNLQVNI